MTLRESWAFSAGMGVALLLAGHFLASVSSLIQAAYLLQLDLKKLVISDEGGPYLTRYHLFKCRRFRVFLHHIHRPDKDRHVHNHPFPWARAFILSGGYHESITRTNPMSGRTGYLTHDARTWSSEAFEPGNYHRIVHVQPGTWTLFFAGRRSRDWGFLVDGAHVPCRKYLGLPPDHDFGD